MDKWISGNGHGTIEAGTGFGKSRVSTNIINWLQKGHPDISIIIVVPTTALQEQWAETLVKQGCNTDNIRILIINTVIKGHYDCDLLIADEAHRYSADTFQEMFNTISYKMILCLTATFERLDGKHRILAKYAPVVDRITIEECLLNGWVSNYKEYAVLIEPADIDVYNDLCKQLTKYYEFFNYDFSLAMSMIGKNGWKNRYNYARSICKNAALLKDVQKQVTINAFGLMRVIQARKKYIYDHPEKIRVAEEIIAARPGKKIITFSASVATAEKFGEGLVYTGKDSRKKNRITLDEFNNLKEGVLHTVKLAEEGVSIDDLSVGIMLGVNSSKTKHTQTRGRIIRYQEGKEAEFFTLILKDTVELEWWRRSTGTDKVEIVDEENLMHILNHEPYETYKSPLKQFVDNV